MIKLMVIVLIDFFLITLVATLLAAIVVAPIYIYFNGGFDALGLLLLLVFYTLFCLGLIFKK